MNEQSQANQLSVLTETIGKLFQIRDQGLHFVVD